MGELMRTWKIIFQIIMCTLGNSAVAKDDWTYYSLQAAAFTANAGGQTAFALRRRANDQEWSLFANQYLQAGDMPLIGLTWDRRFELTSPVWPVRPYLQAGAGVCSGGPLVELMWGMTVGYLVRIDIVTHLIVSPKRLVNWNYPFWTGVTIPL
jgi:hypothetical protein